MFRLVFFAGIFVALRRLVTMIISGTMTESDIVPMRGAKVEVDIGGVDTWATIESWATLIEPTRGTTPTQEERSLDQNNHIGYGTAGSATVNCTIFATQDATDPLPNLYTQLNQPVDIRWSKSGAASEKRWYTSGGILTACPPPGFNADANTSTKIQFTITAPDIEVETIPTA